MGISALVIMPAAALVLLPALRAKGVSLRLAARTALNSAAGLALLALLEHTGEGLWIHSWADIAAAGILGIPGVGVIYLVRWMLG